MHQSEMRHLEQVECDRIAAWTFTEIREKWLNGGVRWREIPGLEEEWSQWTNLPEMELELPPFPCRAMSRRFKLHTMSEKQESDGRVHRLVGVTIEVQHEQKQSRQFTYRVILTKKPTSPPDTPDENANNQTQSAHSGSHSDCQKETTPP